MNIIKINHYIECSKILKLYMKIDGPLLNATFISRPNRFITMVKINNNIFESHLADPGRLEE